MKILIFGLGFLGYPLAQKCDEAGDTVGAVKKHLTSDDVYLPIALDTLDLAHQNVQAAWADYDSWVILLPPSAVENYVATMNWLIQQAEQYGITHLIYTSSTSVFGTQAGYVDESSNTQPETESAQKIVQVEQRLHHAAIEHVDILRLGGLYAANRHPLNALLSKNRPLTDAHVPVNMVHRDRAVAGIFQAIHTPNGKRLRHFVETPHLTKAEFYQREAKLLGMPQPIFMDSNQADGAQHTRLGKVVLSQFDDFGFQAA